MRLCDAAPVLPRGALPGIGPRLVGLRVQHPRGTPVMGYAVQILVILALPRAIMGERHPAQRQ